MPNLFSENRLLIALVSKIIHCSEIFNSFKICFERKLVNVLDFYRNGLQFSCIVKSILPIIDFFHVLRKKTGLRYFLLGLFWHVSCSNLPGWKCDEVRVLYWNVVNVQKISAG